ncbi:MAG TPA: MFS transporter [Candidatus Limnocylindrales bacterium]|nr:MFS transporter [Candidatus Limnocylindrales bacterium]
MALRGGLPPLDRNGRLLVAGKLVRSFAFGLGSVVLGLHLAELRLSGPQIGAVLSAALLGTMLLTLLITLRGDRIGRRRLLLAGSLLMVLVGLLPLAGAEPMLLMLIGLSGVVAVNPSDSTGLQTLDQAALPSTVEPRHRTAAFGLYGLIGTGAAAAGGLVVGPLAALGELLGTPLGSRYLPAFLVYAAAGLVAAVLAWRLDARVESATRPPGRLGLHRSRRPVAVLAGLFGLDSLASGFAVQSFLALWFETRFGLGPALLGLLFGASNVLSALSFPVAAWLAGRIGLVRTMVFSHIPANLLLIAVALVPWGWLAAALYLGRSFLSSMDVPARQSYLMAIVEQDERTAAAGLTNLAKSIANSAGPVLAGSLLVPLGLGVPLVACGLLKTAYDLSLFALFSSRPAPEETAGP